MTKRCTWLLLAMLPVNVCLAQDFSARIRAMQTTYNQMTAARIVMRLEVYEGGDSKRPMYSEVIDIRKDGLNYYSRMEQSELMMNERYIIVVDAPSRLILVTKRTPEKEKEYTDPFQSSLDSILLWYEEPIKLERENGVEHFRLMQRVGDVEQVELFLNPETNLMTRLEYRYREGQWVVIVFEKFETSPHFADDEFSEGRFFRKVGKEFKTTDLYSRFNLSFN